MSHAAARVVGLLVPTLLLVPPAQAAIPSPQHSSCSPAWTIVQPPGSGSNDSLYGMDALSASDAWAVGSHYDGITDRGLAQHWDGSTWATVPTPVTGTAAYLDDVVQVAADDAWAVGWWTTQGGKIVTLALHWGGSSWSVVDTPSPGAISSYLVGVTAGAPDDVWAVGYQVTGAAIYQTLALHWDGSAWSVVDTPDEGDGDNLLQGVSAASPDDVWAVGSSEGNGGTQNLVIHWTGSSWSSVPSPSPSPTSNTLFDVQATSASEAWTVGSDNDGSDNVTLVERWDGHTWDVVPSPNVPDSGNVLNEVAAVTGQDVWAAGYYYPTIGNRVFETLTLHWDGRSWILVPSPDPGGNADSYLRAVAALPSGEVWAVGSKTGASVIQHLCEVGVTDAGFSASRTTLSGGLAAAWTFPDSNALSHDVRDASGLDLFDSGTRDPGGSFVFTYPGAGSYRVAEDDGAYSMLVGADVLATPKVGGQSTTFTVAWALEPAPEGLVFDVQLQRPGDPGFSDWHRGVVTPEAVFIPDRGPGSYVFRARVRRLSGAQASAWSRPCTIRVRA